MTKATHASRDRQLKHHPRDLAQDIVWDRSSYKMRERVKRAIRNPLHFRVVNIMLSVEHAMSDNTFTNLRF